MPLPQGIALKTTQTHLYLKDAMFILVASVFIAICSQISVPHYFSPVPFTLQTFAIAMTGWMLGSKRGALAVLAYLLEGAMGFPVFAHGSAGIAVFMGPTGGYLIGFMLGAMASGAITYGSTNLLKLAAGFLACSACIHLCGLPWLSLWVGTANVLQLGFFPFVIGDLMKIGVAICTIKVWAANKERFSFPNLV